MRGITEERLKELSLKYKSSLVKRLFIYLIDKECEELNAWQPIETAPLRKKIRLFEIGPNGQCDGEILFESHRKFYTHWQELPEDPK